MNIETERKFLVRSTEYLSFVTESHRMTQGYICAESGRTVRVRISDDKAWLTIKGPSADGVSRFEWEKEIPADEAHELMKLCVSGIIDKTRHIVPAGGGRRFEVDEFHGDNEGLTIAEIELGSADEAFARPDWLGGEVTGDKRYYNALLSKNPYKNW